MTRLLAVLGQGDRLPSGHIRGLIYREQLAASGIAAQFVFHLARPILPKLPWLGHRLRGLLTRINERRILRLARGADVIYLQKVIALHLLRALRRETRARIVLDVCDALWLMEDVDAAELDEVLRGVDAVTTDNEVTAAYVRRFNAQCTVVPDPSQVEAFDRRRVELARKPADRIVLGWLGSPYTVFNLFEIREALEELFRRHAHLHLRLVGTGGDARLIPPFRGVRYSCVPSYDRERMIEEVFGMHVGLYPLQDEERCRARGIGKAEIYMSGEAVVVASPVGQIREFIRDGVNGMLAGSTAQWVEQLDRLVRDADLRRGLAAAGLATVRAAYRVEHSFARLEVVLRGTRAAQAAA